MQNFNLHTHTTRCGHAVGTDEEYVLAAIKAGITTLGFSDHVPFESCLRSGERVPFELFDDYLFSIAALKEKYKDQIDIKIGFECEYFEEYHDYYVDLLSHKVDYLILGQHYASLNGTDYSYSASDSLVKLYGEYVCKGIQSGLFTYLAHPEYFMLARTEWSSVCDETIDKICACAAQHNFPLELNLKGKSYGHYTFSDGKSYAYPHRKAMPFYAKHQIQCVFGLDCHNPQFFKTMQQSIDELMEEYKEFKLHYLFDVPLVNPYKNQE